MKLNKEEIDTPLSNNPFAKFFDKVEWMVYMKVPKLLHKYKSLKITSFGEAPASYKPSSERRFTTWTYGRVEKRVYYQGEVNAEGKAFGRGIMIMPNYDVSVGYHQENVYPASGL